MSTLVGMVFLESAVAGIVIGVRSQRFVPGSVFAALGCLGVALLELTLAMPLMRLAADFFSMRDAVMVVLPVLMTGMFTSVALGLRGLVDGAMGSSLKR